MAASLELYIDELVLDGFDRVDQAQVRAAVQRELARLLAEQGIPAALKQKSAINHLDGGSFTASPGASGETIGVQIAGAIYGGLRNE